MTDDTTATPWSPQWIRAARFPQRLRGFDEAEVLAFLESAAAQMQRQRDVEASLRAEIARLESVVANEDVQERAVALFSQAQNVADQLIAEAVQHAQDMMSAARTQEREILGRASGAAESAMAAGPRPSGAAGDPGAEVGYVNTYAKIVAVQLRSVLDALSEQVDRLSEVPDRPAALDGWGHPSAALESGGRPQNGLTAMTALESDNAPDDGEPLIWASMMPPVQREPGW
ncbi:MAG: DivIVA domain-containing protein [Acidimicrobiaceae bacterium]|nr:DivIVA domain-containing protein [Acidimicrobiaceae bacterium]